jgi:hypothetical protein
MRCEHEGCESPADGQLRVKEDLVFALSKAEAARWKRAAVMLARKLDGCDRIMNPVLERTADKWLAWALGEEKP